MTAYRGFMLFPDGRIEEVDEDGGTWGYAREPGLFDDLVLAGYPLQSDRVAALWDGVLDVRVEDGRVIAYSGAGEHDMGAASELFLAWFRENAEVGR